MLYFMVYTALLVFNDITCTILCTIRSMIKWCTLLFILRCMSFECNNILGIICCKFFQWYHIYTILCILCCLFFELYELYRSYHIVCYFNDIRCFITLFIPRCMFLLCYKISYYIIFILRCILSESYQTIYMYHIVHTALYVAWMK